jgi:hypothetical protein
MVPNLEEMDEQQARQFLTELFTNLSAEAEYETRHDDYVMEMPQSGERIRGRENMREFQRSFADNSNPPTIQLRRVTVRDGKIWRDTRYYAEPFDAPQWRAGLVEQMES